MSSSDQFYTSLTPFDQFQGAFKPENYTELAHDWVIVITDVEGSTKAIQEGHYRHVNAVGVASMVAVFNALKPLSIPFVFGGDGATFCIPQNCVNKVSNALFDTQKMAQTSFSLTLRCGIVPYSVIKQSQHKILIAKHKLSKAYFQASFSGNGLNYAEKLVKNDPKKLYSLNADKLTALADYTGFECRWKDVPSPHDETVSLLVLSVAKSLEQDNKVYLDVFNQIQKIYGSVENYRPVQQDYLSLTTNKSNLQNEVKIRTHSGSKIASLFYAWLLPLKVRLGRYWMDNGKQQLETDWGSYKASVVAHTDFRKFDENLRMVIAGDAKQRKSLTHFLETQYKKGLLVYGLHVSDRALMTCVISDYHSNHIHFIDGADGGYAMAAKSLKQRLKTHFNQ